MLGTNNAEFRAAFERHYAINKPAAEIAAEWIASNTALRAKEKVEKAAKKAEKAKKEAAKTAKKAEKAALKSLKEATKAAKVIDAAEAAASSVPVTEIEPLQAISLDLPDDEEAIEVPKAITAAMDALAFDSALDADQASLEFFRLVNRTHAAGEIDRDLADALMKKFFWDVADVKAALAEKDWGKLAKTVGLPVEQVVVSVGMLDSAVSADDSAKMIQEFTVKELGADQLNGVELTRRMAAVTSAVAKIKEAAAARDYGVLAYLMANAMTGHITVETEPELPPNVVAEITDDTVTYTVDLGAAPVEPVQDTAMAAAMQRANAPKGNARKGNAPKGK